MLCRNDQPMGFNYNFGTESVMNNTQFIIQSNTLPPFSNYFLLLDNTNLLLLDNTFFLLLQTALFPVSDGFLLFDSTYLLLLDTTFFLLLQ